METFIALFRGVNVAGHNPLPMKDLARLLEDLGLENVATYIQSGNAVFRSRVRSRPKLAAKIRAEVQKAHGFDPELLLLPRAALERAIAANPFPDAESDPSKLQLFFLASTPKAADLTAIAKVEAASERSALIDDVFYLAAPDGIGRSKLAAKVEKLLGVPATARNWRTVVKLSEMARDA